MIVTEALLVNGCAGKGDVAGLVQRVDAVFECFVRVVLIVCSDPWRVESNVERQDCFCSVNHEEGCVLCRPVWSCAKAP